MLGGGGYAERVLARSDLVWPVPDGVADGQALALVLQGTTAWHLLRTSAQLRDGESVVVHAAAGGVGSLAIQLARRFGAGRVIAVASTSRKRELAEELGADATVDAHAQDLTAALRAANGGARVDVVLEMTGGLALEQSLQALGPFGRVVHFGQAARKGARPVDPGVLLANSWGLAGFWLVHLLSRPERLNEAMDDLFTAVLGGTVRPVVGGVYPLEQARQAHLDLRGRGTVGKLVLQVGRASDTPEL